jgi:hypothetical protein
VAKPDSSAIDAALVALLQADAALTALLPDGVWMDEAGEGCTRFALVAVLDEFDVGVYGGRAYEDCLYVVKAVVLSTTNGDIQAAAARIDELLDDQPLTAAGYGFMSMHRETRVRITEVDDVNAAIRWHHRGGHYRVQMALIGA